MVSYGYKMEKEDYDPDEDLRKINNNPKKFKTGITLARIEHTSVIALTVLLFITFSSYNMTLGIIWLIFRTAEGLIQFINEPTCCCLVPAFPFVNGLQRQSNNSPGFFSGTDFF